MPFGDRESINRIFNVIVNTKCRVGWAFTLCSSSVLSTSGLGGAEGAAICVGYEG